MKQAQLQDNVTFGNRNVLEPVNEHDRSGQQILEMDGLRRKQYNKLSPIVRSDSFQTEQLILQSSNPVQLITPKNETITERLQTFGNSEQIKTKSFRKLIVYFHQKDFIKILLAPYKLPATFSSKHYQLINDLGSSFKQQFGRNNEFQKSLIHQYITFIDIRVQVRLKFRTLKLKCKQYIQFIHNQIPLIEPMSNFKFFWDLICFGVRIYLIVVIPVLIAFHNQNFSEIQQTPLTIFSLALIFDIILRAFTVTYDKGLPVRDRYLLYKKQLTVSTLFEFLSFIITLIIVYSDKIIDKNIIGEGWPKFLLMLHYIQILSILKYIDICQYSLKLSRLATSIVDLIKLITLILLVQHVTSCIWLIFGLQSQEYSQDSWLEKFINDEWSYQFLQSFYFICVTTFTVGYGDLLPKSSAEQIFTIFYMFLCMLLFSYTVNTIGSILTQIKETSEKIKQKITAINEYMHNKAVSPGLQFKVREQLYFSLKQEIVQQVNEQSEIIKLLPDELQHSLKIEAALSLLNKCSFFCNNFPQEVLNQLLENVDFTMHQPGATIQSKEEFYVHIIEQGSVEVIYKKVNNIIKQKIIQTLQRGDYFGLQEFLSQQQSDEFIYKSTAFTSILSIPYTQFRKILEENDVENQKFHNLLQQQTQFQNYCFICQKTGHQTLKCPIVHFIPNYEVVFKRYLYRKKQKKRIKFTRRSRVIKSTDDDSQIKFSNTCLHQKIIEKTATKYKQDNENTIERLFPTLEQPSSIGSASESENDEIDDPKDQSFSVQIPNSHRQSKKMTTLLQTPMSSNNLMSQTIVNRIKKHGFLPANQPQSPNPLSTEFFTQNIRQVKKIIPCKPGTMELDEMKDLNKIDFTNELRRKMNNIILYPKKEQEQIEHCYKKLINLKEDAIELANFETIKNYEIFNRMWNIDSVLKRITMKQKKFRGFKKLKRFLLFPYIYVQKYLDKKDPNDPNKPLEKQKRKSIFIFIIGPTKPKVIKKTRVIPDN